MENKDFLLSRIKIKGLFGYKDIDWELFQDVNILGSINGSGKSTILKCVYNSLHYDYFDWNLFDVIDSVEIEFINKVKIVYSKKNIDIDGGKVLVRRNPVYYKYNVEIPIYFYIINEYENNNITLDDIKNSINVHFVSTFENNLIHEDISNNIGDKNIKTSLDLLIYNQIVKRNALIIDSVSNRELIEKEAKNEFMEKHSNALIDLILDDYRRKGKELNALDLDKSKNIIMNIIDDKATSSRKFLEKELIAIIKEMISTDSLFDIYSCIDSFFNYKVSLKNKSSFEFEQEGNKSTFDCYHLSTGEKQLLYIFLLVFNTMGKSCILLMDEPDLGMHITWKEKFITTLRKINPNAQIILTTHAPSMVRGWVDNVKEIKQITVN